MHNEGHGRPWSKNPSPYSPFLSSFERTILSLEDHVRFLFIYDTHDNIKFS